MPKTDAKQQAVPAGPLLKRIGSSRGATAAFAKKLEMDHGRVSNWKTRGIPWAQIKQVAEAVGLTVDQYLAEAGVEQKVTRAQPTKQTTIEAAKLLEDFNALPDWLQEHIARKTEELRKYADSLPAYVRDGMKGPPKDPASYAAWERNIVDDMKAHQGAAERGKTKERK